MTREVLRRRGSTADHSTFAGGVGETTIDTTKKTVVVHDGETLGGFPLARADGVGSNVVLSEMFRRIIGLWQVEYDALSEIDPDALYIIVPPILIADDSGQLILSTVFEADFYFL